jgi:hypothetical protein
MSPEQLEQRRAAGRALVAKYGRDYMSRIGEQGYWATGQKYGFKTVNKIIWGQHLTRRNAIQARETCQQEQPLAAQDQED